MGGGNRTQAERQATTFLKVKVNILGTVVKCYHSVHAVFAEYVINNINCEKKIRRAYQFVR